MPWISFHFLSADFRGILLLWEKTGWAKDWKEDFKFHLGNLYLQYHKTGQHRKIDNGENINNNDSDGWCAAEIKQLISYWGDFLVD